MWKISNSLKEMWNYPKETNKDSKYTEDEQKVVTGLVKINKIEVILPQWNVKYKTNICQITWRS